MTTRTLICGYCNAARTPGTTCTCLQSRLAERARTREMQARQHAEKAGIAPRDVKKYIGGRN